MTRVRRVAVVLVDRANYGRLRPVLLELKDREDVRLDVLCAGTMVLDRFGLAKEVVKGDGFEIAAELYMELEGSTPGTMAKSIGLGIIEFSNAFERLAPDFVLLIGDRYEALAAAIAAAYQNLCVIHLQGGEVSGSIDESARHAITKFSHYHFPATARAGEFIVAMGESPETVFPLGCPSADVIARAQKSIPEALLDQLGVGQHIDLTASYLLCLFHPVTTAYESAEQQMEQVLAALMEAGQQVVMLWPNIDAGSDGVSQAIRRFRERNPGFRLHVYKNFEPEVYVPILANAACAVGNSSSFVRDASFLGTPIVLVGNRQDGRERSEAVLRVDPNVSDVLDAIRKQSAHGPYPSSSLYGSPGVSRRIADQILTLEPYRQKRLGYVNRER